MSINLVDADRVLHRLADEEAYRRYVTKRGLKMSNMLELIDVGRDVEGKQKKNHMQQKSFYKARCLL